MLSQFVKGENENTPHPLKEIKWIPCRGCKGEIGVPPDLQGERVDCPGCGLSIKPSETILFRPAASAPPPPVNTVLEPDSHPAVASINLLRSADTVFNWGIASIVLGWTIIVPIIGFNQYIHISNEAKKENALVPGKATIGLALSLLFGVAQSAAMIAKLNH